MNTFTIEGWCKTRDAEKSAPIGSFHFHIDNDTHLRMEQAETKLQDTHESEAMIDVDMDNMELQTPEQCGPLSDCQLRVYLNPTDHRGHFHLVGHRASDGSMVYTNALMVDQLG